MNKREWNEAREAVDRQFESAALDCANMAMSSESAELLRERAVVVAKKIQEGRIMASDLVDLTEERRSSSWFCGKGLSMTLRDWFAGMVLPDVYREAGEDGNVQLIADDAYYMADAMLKRREVSDGET